MTEVFKFYGIDWLAMLFTFIAIWLIGNKNKNGFVIMMAGNISWVAIGILTESMAMVIANIVFFSMNTRALLKWTAPESITE